MFVLIIWSILLSSSFIDCGYYGEHGYNAYGENKRQIWSQPLHPPQTFDWSRRYYQNNRPYYRQPYYNAYNDNSERNDPRSELQTTVDQVLYVEKKIKAICNRGHNPSEEITEAHYKRMFNINGYKPETAIVRIKQTVLYSCLDPEIRGDPCLEDVALLPEHLIIEEAVYNIENNKLTITIPFKKNIKDLECNVCGGDVGNNDVMIVSKEIKKQSTGNSYIAEMLPTIQNPGSNQYRTPGLQQLKQNMKEGISFPNNDDNEY